MDRAANIRLHEAIAPAVEALGFELVGCESLPSGRQSILRIYIDSERGVSIDDCALASRQIGAVLDVENLIPGRYMLEVSSPGFDRMLVTLAHYQRFVGSRVHIRLGQPLNGRRNFTGELLAASADEITVKVDADTFHLPLMDIQKANLVPEY